LEYKSHEGTTIKVDISSNLKMFKALCTLVLIIYIFIVQSTFSFVFIQLVIS